MTGMQAAELRDKVQELLKQPKDPAAQKQILDIRKKLATFNRNVNPVLAETETLQVAIEPNAEPGRRELRLATPQGLSNPLVLCVGQLPEFSEPQSEVRSLMPGVNEAEVRAAEAVVPSVAVPVTINGRIMPGAARPQPM